MRSRRPNKSLQATRDGRSCFPTVSGFTHFGPAVPELWTLGYSHGKPKFYLINRRFPAFVDA